jgi:hypothetical protein
MDAVNPVNHVIQHLRLIACPSLALEHGRIDRYVPEGGTVADHLRAIGWQPDSLNARVFLDGDLIDKAQWEYAVPRAGQAFVTRVIPMGGGEGGKSAIRIVAMLAVVVASIWTAGGASGLLPALAGQLGGAGAWAGMVGGSLGAGLAGSVISIAGSLAITARMPPARPRLCEQRQVPHG